jgi:septal ring factor EnvC (AmiA/AmiB activator)
MAKKIANPEKLKTEIALQRSKLNSLKVLDQEISNKIQRLESQRNSLKTKAAKLQFCLERNLNRLNPSR